MNKPKYQIGDVVYIGEWKPREAYDTCPDCGGTLVLKVTLFDDTEYIIPCVGCTSGYDPPKGYLISTRYDAEVRELVIQGVGQGCWSEEIGKWKYQVGYEGGNGCYRDVLEDEIFTDEQSARAFAIAKGRQLAINEDARVFMKEKPERTWAWHVTYHRREIKRAEHDLEYHTKKLNAAKAKSGKGNG